MYLSFCNPIDNKITFYPIASQCQLILDNLKKDLFPHKSIVRRGQPCKNEYSSATLVLQDI